MLRSAANSHQTGAGQGDESSIEPQTGVGGGGAAGHPVTEEPELVDLGLLDGRRDPTVPPRGRERDAERERTRVLLSRVADATPAERLAVRDEVVTLHLWLASRAARRYGPRNELDDLVQVARGGLVEAFDRYDPSQTTYAYFAWVTMSGLLRRHLRDHGWSIRPPRSVQEAANVLRGAGPDLAQELGRSPSTTDLATYLGWTTRAVEDARSAELGLRATSLETLVGDAWVPQHPAEWQGVETRLVLQRAVRSLDDAERDLLRMRFLEELTQTQIAATIGTTQMQVSRLLSRLMTKLRGLIGELDPDLLVGAR